MDVFMGTVLGFGFSYAPRGWAFAQGQTIAIQQNSALFSLLGVTYGGNGSTTFQLPNLTGRAPVGAGPGAGGISAYALGQVGGTESTTLLVGNMPAHSHGLNVNTGAASADVPNATMVLGAANGSDQTNGDAVTVNVYAPAAPNLTLNAASIGLMGSNQPFSNMQPYLAINYSIALEGIYPSRN